MVQRLVHLQAGVRGGSHELTDQVLGISTDPLPLGPFKGVCSCANLLKQGAVVERRGAAEDDVEDDT